MRNWIKRAVRTFIQTSVGYIAVNAVTLDFTADRAVIKTALAGLGVSAAAAGLAAVMNIMDDRKGG